MNTRYRKPFVGSVTDWVQACRKAYPQGRMEYFCNLTFWVQDGVDVGCYNQLKPNESWIKEKFQ